jgi:hypothetical protein
MDRIWLQKDSRISDPETYWDFAPEEYDVEEVVNTLQNGMKPINTLQIYYRGDSVVKSKRGGSKRNTKRKRNRRNSTRKL